MKFFKSLFKGLQGKLTLTYTLVTVMALMALEIVLLFSAAAYSEVTNTDNYMNDIISTLVPEARSYMQPEPDLAGLQVWLTTLTRKGYASIEPENLFDSPAAAIVPFSPIYILSPQGEILAQNEYAKGVTFIPYSQSLLDNALAGNTDVHDLYMVDGNGKNWMAVPIYQKNHNLPVLGVIVLTVEPLPNRSLSDWAELVGLLMMAGILLMVALAPFGAIFGFILSKSFSKRLTNLSAAAEAWGKGNFTVMPPPDRSQDEIGALGGQMREMARRINMLMEDQQSLAQIQERNRIAQELHDTVKQQNFATLMQVRAARNSINADPFKAQESLKEAEKLIKDSQQELAVIITELRPPALEGKNLADAIQGFVDSWSKNACIPATVKVEGEVALPLEVERTFYRILQEGLSNIARHSRASACNVQLIVNDIEVCMTIIDNGIGFDIRNYQNAGFGLISMQDRLAKFNGKLEIRTGPVDGTQLTARISIPPKIRGSGKETK